jgi:pheromone shutdown-related protein TraB
LIERIKLDGKEIILVGTAHISDKSVEQVKEIIESEQPDVVGVELCAQRFQQLKSGRQWQETNVSQIVKTGKIYLFLINLLLSNIQKRLGAKMGVKPGSEMLEATKLAQEKKVPIALLDRNVTITLKRAIALMSFWEKVKLLFSIVFGLFSEAEELTKEKVEELKRKDIMTELIQELSEKAPTVKRVLVDERDAFIAHRIRHSPGKKIVAVVGAGHLQGIKENLPKDISIRALETLPKKRNYLKYLAYAVPVLFVAFVVYAFLVKGFGTSLSVLFWWFLINGVLSGLGVLLARGHPLTILSAFLAAPFTSLHPAVAAGWFAAAVETKMSVPKVKDFEMLGSLGSFTDFTKNRVTKILLVAAFANIGSTLGTVVALPYILSLLA